MRHSLFEHLIFLILVLFSSCLSKQEQPRLPLVVAMVNGNSIKEDDLRVRLNLERFNYDEKTLKDPETSLTVKKKIVDQVIRNRAIIDWGLRHGITLTVEERAKGMEKLKKGYTSSEFELMLKEKNVSYTAWSELSQENLAVEKVMNKALYATIKITNAEMTDYYKNHRDDFVMEESVRVRQIVADSAEKAQKLWKRIMNGENFAKVALLHSISPDRATGGDLGFFSRGTHPQEFDEACFRLVPGEISPVVKSPYGFHIFKLIDKRPKRTLSLEEVLPHIESVLLEKKMRDLFDPWCEKVLSESVIQIREDALKEMEL